MQGMSSVFEQLLNLPSAQLQRRSLQKEEAAHANAPPSYYDSQGSVALEASVFGWLVCVIAMLTHSLSSAYDL
jgi:hypothetical protein